MPFFRPAPLLLAFAAAALTSPAADATRVGPGPGTVSNFEFNDLFEFPNAADRRGVERFRVRTAFVPASPVPFVGTSGTGSPTLPPEPEAPVPDLELGGPEIGDGDGVAPPPPGDQGVAIPTPSAAIAGLIGLGVMGLRRRRDGAAGSVEN